MKYSQLIGVLLVVAGSFLPLVKVPIIGIWNYYQIEPTLAIIVYLVSAISIFALLGQKFGFVRLMGVLLLIVFLFTIAAIKYKSLRFFSFLPFDSWMNFAAELIHLKWGWIVEFVGASLMLLTPKKNLI